MDAKTVAFVVAFLVISLGIHEAAHAWVANLCGDSTAKDMGRMTLNPIPHIDPIMTILLPALLFVTTGFAFGGAKPVPVAYQRLRKPARDMMLVALAGPLSNILIAFVLLIAWKALVFGGGYTPGMIAPLVLGYSVQLNLLLALFNMVPLPPLDGSRVISYLLPRSMRASFQSLDRFGMIFIFILFYSGFLIGPLRSGIAFVNGYLDIATGGSWS